jgi:hypothetical protein
MTDDTWTAEAVRLDWDVKEITTKQNTILTIPAKSEHSK